MSERKPPEKAQPMDSTSTRTAPVKRKDASLGRDVQAKIGQQLRAYYDGLIEPTPERFADMLRQLEKPVGGKGSE